MRGKSLIGIAREVRAALINAYQSLSFPFRFTLAHDSRVRVRPRDFGIYRDSARCVGGADFFLSPRFAATRLRTLRAREKEETDVSTGCHAQTGIRLSRGYPLFQRMLKPRTFLLSTNQNSRIAYIEIKYVFDVSF